MNLIEAHRSGRAFKRQDEKDFYELRDMADARGHIPLEDAVAEDYILEPEAKLLTKEEVGEAVIYALDKLNCTGSMFNSEMAAITIQRLFPGVK